MKKLFKVNLVLLAVLIVLTSCNAKNYADMETADTAPSESYKTYATGNSGGSLNFNYKTDGDYGYATKDEAIFDVEAEEPQSQYDSRKIIYNSHFSIQTNEFDNAINALELLCEKYGAYYESANCNGTAEYANRYGSYTVRIPVQNYDSFRNEAGTIGIVTSSSENNRDVTENYFDTEARLTSAKLREERLLEILKTANTLDNVLLLESELANVRYEIESYSGTLRKYDSLVSYSTITFNINEVIKPVEVKYAPKTFTQRIAQATNDGFSDFSDWFEDLLVDLSYNLPLIIILVIIAIFATVIIRVKILRISKNKVAKIATIDMENGEKDSEN